MSDGNYEKLLGKISRVSGIELEELERRVEAKRSKLSGLISKEGAVQVIAAELGISFDNEMFKIDELVPGMRKVNIIGKIIKMFPVREFTTKKGDKGKVVNMVLADDTSNIKVVLWDTNHIGLIEKGEVAEGKSVEIKDGSMRDGELHLGGFSEFKLSGQVFENVISAKVVKEKSISEFNKGDSVSVRSFIVQSFDPRFFHVCPECKKKVVSGSDGFICAEHGKVTSLKKALINIVLDDGTENIRAVVFSDLISDLGITELEDVALMTQQRENLLGKEMMFSGNVRLNNYFNNDEFIIDGIQEINLDELIGKLEK